jgi:hypothetical protein
MSKHHPFRFKRNALTPHYSSWNAHAYRNDGNIMITHADWPDANSSEIAAEREALQTHC